MSRSFGAIDLSIYTKLKWYPSGNAFSLALGLHPVSHDISVGVRKTAWRSKHSRGNGSISRHPQFEGPRRRSMGPDHESQLDRTHVLPASRASQHVPQRKHCQRGQPARHKRAPQPQSSVEVGNANHDHWPRSTTETPLLERSVKIQGQSGEAESAMARRRTADEVASVVLFLLSPASSLKALGCSKRRYLSETHR